MASRALADLLPQLEVVGVDGSCVPESVKNVDELLDCARRLLGKVEGPTLCELEGLQAEEGALMCRRGRDDHIPLGTKCVLHAVAVARTQSGQVVEARSCTSGTVGAEPDDDLEAMVVSSLAPKHLVSDEFVLSPRVAALQEIAHALRVCQVEGLFEIHVTVAGEDVQEFQRACAELGKLKVIQIELNARASQNKRLRDQLMTASYHKCSSIVEAQRIAFRFASVFVERGFAIERVKIEAMLHSEGVPTRPEDCPESCYFEFHAKLLLEESQLGPLHELCKTENAHLSRNALKTIGDRQHRFVTLRLYGTSRDNALATFERVVRRLEENKYEIVSKQREFSVFDTNVNLDSSWLDKSLVQSLGS